jgi:hypothetical protein
MALPSQKDYQDAHTRADTDADAFAIHHTLGPNPGQAAPGEHIHNGKTNGTVDIPSSANPGITKWLNSGTYNTVGNANMPDGNWYMILHMRHTNPLNNYAHQMAFRFAAGFGRWSRQIENNVPGAWTAF